MKLEELFVQCQRCKTNVSLLALVESKFFVESQGRTRVNYRCPCGESVHIFRDEYVQTGDGAVDHVV